jgi:hypothetical protein
MEQLEEFLPETKEPEVKSCCESLWQFRSHHPQVLINGACCNDTLLLSWRLVMG